MKMLILSRDWNIGNTEYSVKPFNFSNVKNIQLPQRIKIERRVDNDYFAQRIKLFEEIIEYKKALKKSKQDLEKLKQEREIILRRLNLLKSILVKKKKLSE